MGRFKYSLEYLKELQNLPLNDKIALSKVRIEEFVSKMGGGQNVVVSFSGGKDSTVLLNIVREIDPDIKGVYCDTGLEYPEIKAIVKSYKNIDIIKPKMNFKDVIKEYGWVYPSKEIAKAINAYQRNVPWGIAAISRGEFVNGNKSLIYTDRYMKWKYVADSGVNISSKCCDIMKKEPFDEYQKENNVGVIIGTMASESKLRKDHWREDGCNVIKKRKSKPLSFWTEQDIFEYIVRNNIEIADVYGKIVKNKKTGKWETTGEKRTGCMFCLIGSHLEKPNKIQRMKITHPNIYNYCLNQLGMKEVMKKIGVPYD